MTSITSAVQKLNPGDFVSLFVMDATVLGGSVYRFTKRLNNASYVSFGGIQYPAIDIEAKGFTWDGKGAFPTPTFRISNVGGLVSSAIISLKDLVGATVTRIRTLEEHLDGGADPDVGKTFPVDIFTIEQKIKSNNVYVEWRLSSSLDASDVQLPGRPILRDICTRQYRIYNSIGDSFDYSLADCPYTGARFYNDNDKEVNNKSSDMCSKRITGCKARFGQRAELPTWAFPGVAIVV